MIDVAVHNPIPLSQFWPYVACTCMHSGWCATWAVLNTDLPRKAYNMVLYNLDANGKRDWVLNVKMQLFQYGFVWMNQGVGRLNDVIRAFCVRLIDCRWQDCEDHVQTSDRFSMYRRYNSIFHCTKTYIAMNMDMTYHDKILIWCIRPLSTLLPV